MEAHSSLTATLALLLWMPFSLLVFALTKPHRAAAILLVYGTILLPELEYFDIKLLPNMTKKTIVCAWVFFPALLWARSRLKRFDLGKMPWVLFALMVLVDVGRALTNRDPLVVAPGTIINPILTHTALTFIMEDFLLVFVPYFIGATLFKERDALRDFMRIFVGAGLVYLPFVAVELRLSPQWHAWVYGYHQHDWLQVMRDGAYRPMVFMQHGLAVALFMATCTVLAFGLSRAKEKIARFRAFPFAVLLAMVVGLSHSLGAFVFVVALAPLVWLMSPRMQLRVAALLAGLVMFYPIMRAYDWFPTKAVVDFARSISEDRAGSIDFRFRNEDMALIRALERPIFGWGGFDRIAVYDKETGYELTTLDGYWVITYAASGALGFISRFGLLTWPIWQAFRRIRRVPAKADQFLLSTMGVATAMIATDLLPNGMFTYFPHLFAGVLMGATRQLTKREAVRVEQVVAERPRRVGVPAATGAYT